MDPSMLVRMKIDHTRENNTQYRPRPVEFPTRLDILKRIQEEEDQKSKRQSSNQPTGGTASRSSRLTGSVGINMGLDLEMRQYVRIINLFSRMLIFVNIYRQNLRVKVAMTKVATTQQTVNLGEARRKIAKALDTWFAMIPEFIPADALQESMGNDLSPERELLRLPSDFNFEARERLGLQDLAKTEYQLRLGQAHDALQKLRSALGLKSFLVRRKYRLASGQGPLLRSNTEIDHASRQVQKWQEVYKRAYTALTNLRQIGKETAMEDAWSCLQELQDTDCIMLSEWMENHKFWKEKGERAEAAAAQKGQGRQELPWFWKFQFKGKKDGSDLIDKTVEDWATDGTYPVTLFPHGTYLTLYCTV